jgi:hypothetical protein
LAKTDIGHSFLVYEECSPHEHGTLFFYAERKTFVTGPNKDPVTGIVRPVAALLMWLQFQSGSIGRPELTGADDKKVVMARRFLKPIRPEIKKAQTCEQRANGAVAVSNSAISQRSRKGARSISEDLARTSLAVGFLCRDRRTNTSAGDGGLTIKSTMAAFG